MSWRSCEPTHYRPGALTVTMWLWVLAGSSTTRTDCLEGQQGWRGTMTTMTEISGQDVQISPAAQAVEMRKTYGTGQAAVNALDGVDVSFERGWFTAVMGPSGSGKSTLMHCMAGLDRPTSGQSFIGGLDIGSMGDTKLTQLRRDRMGFVFQSFNLVPTLTAAENITLPADLAGHKVDQAWFDYLVDKVGLAGRLSHRPGELSGGQQQRVACARALINKPELVFADEPTGNLDSNASAELLSFLRWSVTELGQSIVMVTHDPRGAGYADRVVFLADGKVVGQLDDPTTTSVLQRMQALGAAQVSPRENPGTPGPEHHEPRARDDFKRSSSPSAVPEEH
jgi:putative ABC transport system ATP-binding protein